MDELETDKLKKLKAARAAMDARIREEQRKLREAEHKRDTHRKVLQGACVEEWARRDSEFAARLMTELKAFLVRDGDRALFGLPPTRSKE